MGMCGIYGWSFGRKPRITPGQREVLSAALAVANATRGRESWGYFARSGDKGVVHREVGCIAGVPGLGSLGSWGTFMAHTRQSTTGDVTRENCHPFQVGNLLLAHNGVIVNHEELNKQHQRTCEVDSIHLAKHLAADLPFSDIEGYGAIEWIDIRKPLAVNLCRMSGGSLSVAGVKSRGRKVGVVWSSDSRHLREALDAARLDWFMFEDLKEGQVYQAHRGRYFILTSHRSLDLASPTDTWKGRAAMARAKLWGWGDGDDEVRGAAHAVVAQPRDLLIHTLRGEAFKVSGRTEWFKDADGEWRPHYRNPSGEAISLNRRPGEKDEYDEVQVIAGPPEPSGASDTTAIPATRGHTPVDRGLWADANGRIHDTEFDDCGACGESLTDEGLCPTCDAGFIGAAGVSGIYSLTDREWIAANERGD